MAFHDLFRERTVIEPDDTYRLCGIRKRAEIYDLAGFGDPMTEWKKREEESGATIVPKEVYLTRYFEQHDHRVAWVYHSRPEGDSVLDQHHIACDCVADLENPYDEMDEILSCPAVLAALEYRAARVNTVLGTAGILGFYGKPEGSVAPKQHSITTIKALVNFIMNYEQTNPDDWVANLVSGEHQVPLLASILQVQPLPDPELPDRLSMVEVINEMHGDGSLVLHENGLTVSLPIAA